MSLKRACGAHTTAAWIAAAIVAVGSVAQARPAPEARRHERLHLRLGIGAAWQGMQGVDRGVELRARGASLELDATVGWGVEENLILGVTGLYWHMLSPRFTADGDEPPGADGSVSAVTVGPALTYYLMPLNLYFSGSLGLGFMFMTRPAEVGPEGSPKRSFSSDAGWTFRVAVGKEWWVHDEWGLGANAFLMLHNFPEPEDLPVWGGPSFGVAVSATWD